LKKEEQDLIEALRYSYDSKGEQFQISSTLESSLQIVSNFFCNNISNKICLVFPCKEFFAQWLSITTVLLQIKKDFEQYNSEMFDSYKSYRIGDKLLLNNKSIVEWLGIKHKQFKGPTFKTSDAGEISIRFSDILKLQKAPDDTKPLSKLNMVRKCLDAKIQTPLEKLLKINVSGNLQFVKNKICLISKYNQFIESSEEIFMNQELMSSYLQFGKIVESHVIESPLLVSNNLSYLASYLASSNSVSKIIIDSFASIYGRSITDFAEIDMKHIPTVLITDLSEIESFENINNFGFDFFNFTNKNLKLDHSTNHSPFYSFNMKLKNYLSFNVIKVNCQDIEIESIANKIHSIEKDESNNDLISLTISLIKFTNFVARVAHVLTEDEISKLNSELNNIDALFIRSRMWLGDSFKPIGESIQLLKSVIEKFASHPSEKCDKLKQLLVEKQYDYIICKTEDEARSMNDFIIKSKFTYNPLAISVADVNDKLSSKEMKKAIVIGWIKSKNINRIFSSFLFSELTVLFYQFESKYYNSLMKRNRQYIENINTSLNSKGIRSVNESAKLNGFFDLYTDDTFVETTSESSFDILDFELKLDNAQYSKYIAKENIIESIKAKRIDFENDFFIYSTESHKFLFMNELIEKQVEKANLYRRKIESLQTGDVIAFINTDRDILVELVEKNTNPNDLASIKQWTELWKNLLKEYYTSIGNDFKKLVEDLRKYDCKKHEATIRTWLQDESRIGPEDDVDLISIALLTSSDLLIDNIKKVRENITQMKGLRHDASEFIIKKIKAQIQELADSSFINMKILVEGLGSVIFLRVIEVSNKWENIDVKYVNRLLQKEII
jgi:hypothetical protein